MIVMLMENCTDDQRGDVLDTVAISFLLNNYWTWEMITYDVASTATIIWELGFCYNFNMYV